MYAFESKYLDKEIGGSTFYFLASFFLKKNVDFKMVFKRTHSFMNSVFLYKIVNMTIFK